MREIDATDFFTGKEVKRPVVDSAFRFDFDVRQKTDKIWRYVNSSNYLEDYTNSKFGKHIQNVEKAGGLWRIVDVKTATVVMSNDKAIQKTMPPLRL
jgi:hypothetical protein